MAIRGEENLFSSPILSVGFGHGTGENEERQTPKTDGEHNLGSGDFLLDPAFNELLNRMNIAGDHIGIGERGGNREIREDVNAGTFRYLPSPQTQVFPDAVPERFRAGRESLSVVRNVTVRDPKRTKARAKDDDYRRRVSTSPSMMLPLAHHSHSGQAAPRHHLSREESSTGAGVPGISPSPLAGKDNSSAKRWGTNPGLPDSNPMVSRGTPSPGTGSFEITLIYEGNRIGHRVN
jgi:hypothetical protein